MVTGTVTIAGNDPILDGLKVWFEGTGDSLDQQIKRSPGTLELVALVFQSHDFRQDFVHQFAVVFDVVLGRDRHDVAASRQLADQNPSFVANQRRVDVLVGLGRFVDCVNMHAAFVCESALAHERLAVSPLQVRRFIDVATQFGQVRQRPAPEHLVVLFLERQVRHH